jgi:hypothetical protein
MATDNKINANNSSNFALIDYFHDMSLLKEGDGVNFQKASCTLDGCVKIYTSRVDSVATETGKLLSGLADSRDKRGRGEEGEEGEEDEDGEDGQPRKSRKKVWCIWHGKSRDLADWFLDTLSRSHPSTIICLSAAKEVRTRVCCGPAI